jgi:ligand-binding SRPBCC domain-containing protein
MVTLNEITLICAPLERVFDLARSIDVHLLGNVHHGEQAQALGRRNALGRPEVTSGLIGPGEQVTWRARHFLVSQRLTSAITAYDRPAYFQDTMLHGAFHAMQHDHWFRALPRDASGRPATEMRDQFRFSAPLGPLGRLAEVIVLRRYMRALLAERNAVIRQVAESKSEDWRKYLPPDSSPLS